MDEIEKEAIRKAKEWLNTDDGRESFRKSLQEAEENSQRFSEARYVDPKVLREPYTI